MQIGLMIGAVALILGGCAREEEVTTRSIDEIHRDEGVPVRVRSAEAATFRSYLSFTTGLSGAAESTASAMIADEIAGVLFEVGDFVSKDTPVVLFPSDNPTLNYEQARVGFESARTAFERVESLYEDEGVSQQTYDDARTRFDLARAAWETVQNMARVRAPISGYITRINVFESDNVYPGDPLFTVSDFSELKATVWLTDRQVQHVRVGQTARAEWRDTVIIGRVVQVDLAMDQNHMAFAAKLRFDNSDLLVRSGVTADVEIETYRNDDAIILNRHEVIDDGRNTSVFVVREDRTVRTPIEIARRQDLFVEVSEGLNPGDEVVIDGMELVGDGTTVRVVERESALAQR